ncbi:MAG: DUF2934 domain-containing protein [Acidobacteria bacterium]|nr:DUF2934 domain-containing protein [Acidobacteriota bacterium]MBI3279267.1 DUF2934 domain-containing protein [Acidobacteriota bacterium]
MARKNSKPPAVASEMSPARNLPDAANADSSLQGYAAVQRAGDYDKIARRAYELWEERNRNGETGDADGDWFRAESEVSRRRIQAA